jgi:hypothetical protein
LCGTFAERFRIRKEIKPEGMIRAATKWVSKIIRAILEYGFDDATFCPFAGVCVGVRFPESGMVLKKCNEVNNERSRRKPHAS